MNSEIGIRVPKCRRKGHIWFRREDYPSVRVFLDSDWPAFTLISDVALEWLGNWAQIGDGLITFRLENACATYALVAPMPDMRRWKAKKLCEWGR